MNEKKASMAEHDKNLTDKNSTLLKLNAETNETHAKISKMHNDSTVLRNHSEQLLTKIGNIKTDMNKVQTDLTADTDVLHKIQADIDEEHKVLHENGLKMAKFHKDMMSSKDFLDKLKIEDLPNVINKTRDQIVGFHKDISVSMNESNATQNDLNAANDTIHEAKKNITDILESKKVRKMVKKASVSKRLHKMREIFDKIKKTFPILPEVFMNNMWTFMTLNIREGTNYLEAIRPSHYGMFDWVYNAHSPERKKRVRDMLKRRGQAGKNKTAKIPSASGNSTAPVQKEKQII